MSSLPVYLFSSIPEAVQGAALVRHNGRVIDLSLSSSNTLVKDLLEALLGHAVSRKNQRRYLNSADEQFAGTTVICVMSGIRRATLVTLLKGVPRLSLKVFTTYAKDLVSLADFTNLKVPPSSAWGFYLASLKSGDPRTKGVDHVHTQTSSRQS